ncbi:MAG: hypothetical protein H0V82_11395 [Candidatus Protochlamydia sp.]|nr:hypothetical protein [Candidatus Protochlamydia sp.]
MDYLNYTYINEPICFHENHLFSNPLCDEQSLLRRIFNVAFHIFTFAIPLAIYHIASWCFAKIDSNRGQRLASIIEHNRLTHPYTPLGQEALDFARRKLSNQPQINAGPFSDRWGVVDHQPANQEILRLDALLKVSFHGLKKALKLYPQDPWSRQTVIDATDVCMKISYAISSLTLDDLEPFIQNLAARGINRTNALALTRQDSYQFRTFFYATRCYHCIRGAAQWGTYRNGVEGLMHPQEIPLTHSLPFYQAGTVQNRWNTLYNDYCDRIRLYVNEAELQRADNRHFMWTQKDTGITEFVSIPDTLPT